MSRGFRLGGAGAGSQANPIIISFDQINYPCDATLTAGTDYRQFSYPNQPKIYDVDMKKYNTLTIVSRNTYGNGSRIYLQISGGPDIYRGYTNTNWTTDTIDISNYNGVETIKIMNNANSTIQIRSMVMS